MFLGRTVASLAVCRALALKRMSIAFGRNVIMLNEGLSMCRPGASTSTATKIVKFDLAYSRATPKVSHKFRRAPLDLRMRDVRRGQAVRSDAERIASIV